MKSAMLIQNSQYIPTQTTSKSASGRQHMTAFSEHRQNMSFKDLNTFS